MTSENRDSQQKPAAEPSESRGVRRAYHTPKLRRLGSVRELTLGTGTLNPDGGGARAGGTARRGRGM